MSIADWNEESSEEMSVQDMDALIADMKAKKAAYKDQDAEAKKLYADYSEAEAKVIAMLEKTNRDVFISGDGTRVSLSYAMSVQTPKTVDEKIAFFNWLRENKGKEVADAYMTVNSNSLNSLYNELTEEWARKGEVLSVPGLSEPVARKKLSVRN